MKKTILVFTLLLSANAFAAAVKNCSSGNCSVSELKAYADDFRSTRSHSNQSDEEYWAWQNEMWKRERIESEARRDENMKKYGETRKEPGQTYETCVSKTYEKATEIIGDNAKYYISLSSDGGVLDNCEMVFDVTTHGEACEYFSELSAIAKPHFTTAEYCRFLAEKLEVLKDYRDRNSGPAFTQSVQRERDARLKPIYKRHDVNVSKLFDAWEQKQKGEAK